MKPLLCIIVLLVSCTKIIAQKSLLSDTCFVNPDSFDKNRNTFWYTDKVVFVDTIIFNAYYDKNKINKLCSFRYFIDKVDNRETVSIEYYYFNKQIACTFQIKNFNDFRYFINQKIFTNIERVDVAKMQLSISNSNFIQLPIDINTDSSDLHNYTIYGKVKSWHCNGALRYEAEFIVDSKIKNTSIFDYSRELVSENYTAMKHRKISYSKSPSYENGLTTVYFSDGSIFQKTLFKNGSELCDSVFYKNDKVSKQETSLSVSTPHYFKRFDNDDRLKDSVVYSVNSEKKDRVAEYIFSYHNNGVIKMKEITLFFKKQTLKIYEGYNESGKQQDIAAFSYDNNKTFFEIKTKFILKFYENGNVKEDCRDRLFFKLHPQYKKYNNLPDSLNSLQVEYNESNQLLHREYVKKNGDSYEFNYFESGKIKAQITKIKNVIENTFYYENGFIKSYYYENDTKKIIKEFNLDGTILNEEIYTKPKDATWR